MCDHCGCEDVRPQTAAVPTTIRVPIDRDIFEENDRRARTTSHDLVHRGVLAINVMGAPGSGKTTVIEMLATFLGKERIAVIQGDLESDVDKVRLERAGIRAFQINTHSGCHLNAAMIAHALEHLSLDGISFLFIENVGNLVCPAGVQLGQHVNIVVSSTAEGSDKPKKYPHIFRDADAILISKTDLVPYVSFDELLFRDDLTKIARDALLLGLAKNAPAELGPLVTMLEERRTLLTAHHH